MKKGQGKGRFWGPHTKGKAKILPKIIEKFHCHVEKNHQNWMKNNKVMTDNRANSIFLFT